MSFIKNRMDEIKSMNRIGFMGHVVAGFPDIETSFQAAMGISEGGADFLEIQFPFSDPFADGPLIENACIKALDNGIKIEDCFNLARRVAENSGSIVLIMTYGNIIFKYGVRKFIERAAKTGVKGVIIPDLPPENDENLLKYCHEFDVSPILLAAPGNDSERIRYLSDIGDGFIYTVARVGTTGKKTEIDTDVREWLEKVREYSSLPTAVGFGINSSEQVKKLEEYCDIAIAGSYFVKSISEACEKGDDILSTLKEKTSELLDINT